MAGRTYTLWLCSWYPSLIRPLEGDFIQRHARAVATHTPVHVLALVHDEYGLVTKNTLVQEFEQHDLRETIVYYHTKKTGLSYIDKFFKLIAFTRIFKRRLQMLINQRGKPQLVHNHVVMHAGLLALWLKRIYNIRYIVSEHWTGYLPEATPNFRSFNPWSKRKWRQVMRSAVAVTAVSEYLCMHLSKLADDKPVQRIANVVDEHVFALYRGPQKKRQFIFAGTDAWQKNIAAITTAASILIDAGHEFTLLAVVPESQRDPILLQTDVIKNNIIFLDEMPQLQLATLIRESAALILYSRYETFGCMVIEANAAGVPVIVSDIAPMLELVRDGENGLLAGQNDPQELAKAMAEILNSEHVFNAQNISSKTLAEFGYATVGKQFVELYEKMLKNG